MSLRKWIERNPAKPNLSAAHEVRALLYERQHRVEIPTKQEWLEHMHTRCDPERGIYCPLCGPKR